MLKSKKTRIETTHRISLSLCQYQVEIQENKDWNPLSGEPAPSLWWVEIQENKDWNARHTFTAGMSWSVEIQENKDWNTNSRLRLRSRMSLVEIQENKDWNSGKSASIKDFWMRLKSKKTRIEILSQILADLGLSELKSKKIRIETSARWLWFSAVFECWNPRKQGLKSNFAEKTNSEIKCVGIRENKDLRACVCH